MLAPRQKSRRRAITLVETALVLSTALLLMFGVYEYGRFLMMRQLVENAAREGARFAVAHTNDKTTTDVQDHVNAKLVGLQTANFDNYQVNVTGVVLRARTDPNTNTTYSPGQALTTWDLASSTDGVVVEVKGDFKLLLPSLVRLPATVQIKVKSVMYSEGN